VEPESKRAEPELSRLQLHARSISLQKKRRLISSLSEDDFRDLVIRPLFKRMGYTDARELCGPDEAGKDAIFLSENPMGVKQVTAVQTKKGPLSLGREASVNLIAALTQLRTVLKLQVALPELKMSLEPHQVCLCASGNISERAREHLQRDLGHDSRLMFFDGDKVIDLVDKYYPEYWLSINATVDKYLRQIQGSLATTGGSDAGFIPAPVTAVDDARFVELSVFRVNTIPKTHRGKVTLSEKVERHQITELARQPSSTTLLAVVGEAGSGKTTALRRIAYDLARDGLRQEQPSRIPILVRAVDVIASTGPSLIDRILDYFKTASINATDVPFGTKDLSEGRVVILIDGLDEIGESSEQSALLGMCVDFNSQFPETLVIISSRNYKTIRELPEFEVFREYQLRSFTLAQSLKLLEKLQKYVAKKIDVQSREVMRRLVDVHGMSLNPLLVSIFAVTADDSKLDVPINITELFRKFTEIMLERWDKDKGFTKQYQYPLKDQLLREIAFYMHSKRETSIKRAEFEAFIKKYLVDRDLAPDADQLIDEIVERSGILRHLGDRLEFRHHTLQEFFAGRAIRGEAFVASVIGDEWWRQAIVFYFGDRANDVSGLTAAVGHLPMLPAAEQFTAGTALGLSLQACFLIPTSEKVPIFWSVVEALADSREAVSQRMDGLGGRPYLAAMGYSYLGRHAVALNALPSMIDELPGFDDMSGAAEFWIIVGLLETRNFELAEKYVRKFRPTDNSLSLALDVECVILQNVMLTKPSDKKAVDRIREQIGKRIGSARKEAAKELQDFLADLRLKRLITASEHQSISAQVGSRRLMPPVPAKEPRKVN
jgi:hypothetical protein